MEEKYDALYAPIYAKRSDVINGRQEAPENETGAPWVWYGELCVFKLTGAAACGWQSKMGVCLLQLQLLRQRRQLLHLRLLLASAAAAAAPARHTHASFLSQWRARRRRQRRARCLSHTRSPLDPS